MIAAMKYDSQSESNARIDESMSLVVRAVKLGDEEAVRHIWDRYFPDLVRLAGQRLAYECNRRADGEDVAISAMESFFRAARNGRFPDLNDKDGIWRLLATMTRRKVIDLIRKNRRQPSVGESAVMGGEYEGGHFDWVATADPTPEMVVALADEVQHLLDVLPAKYHPVALGKLECLSQAEIAEKCGVHLSTVERQLRIIRKRWKRELASDQ